MRVMASTTMRAKVLRRHRHKQCHRRGVVWLRGGRRGNRGGCVRRRREDEVGGGGDGLMEVAAIGWSGIWEVVRVGSWAGERRGEGW